MQQGEIQLSKNEAALVADKEVILIKNGIIKKACALFGMLSSEFNNIAVAKQGLLPPQALNIPPKISKGEQYLHLPYVVLDYPRVYTRQDVLAVRCFFWWGNFFSISLHLSGVFLTQYGRALDNWIKVNCNKGWYISTGTNAWQYHFEADNYLPLCDGAYENGIITPVKQRDFIKLAKKLPLEQWDDAPNFFTENFVELLGLLEN